MDDESAEVRRRIAEAKGVQQRLTEMQDRIRQQHDLLDDVIREVSGRGGSSDELFDRRTKVRHLRDGDSR